MIPSVNMSITALLSESGISQLSLYNWCKQAKSRGLAVPGDRKNTEQWSPSNKFAVVIETAALNGAEMAEYCRKKGLLAEQIELWKHPCMGANANVAELGKSPQRTN
jgi:transposase